MPSNKKLAAADEIIGLIYQGVLESPPWRSFLRALRLRLDCDVAAISLRPGRPGAKPILLWDRRDPISTQNVAAAAAAHARLIHLDPLARALNKPGDIFLLEEVISREDLLTNEFYREVIVPNDVEHQLGMYFAEPGGWRSSVGLMNTRAAGAFGETEKTFFRAFRPHLERALEIYARLRRSEFEKAIFEETLDRLTIAAFILDGLGRVIHHNRSAERVIVEQKRITFSNHHLSLERSADTARLTATIKTAIEWREQHPSAHYVDAMRVECSDGAKLGILVRAASSADFYRSDVSPCVIVYVNDPEQAALAPDSFVARVFGLTPSEAQLATLLANGLTLADAATKLGLTQSTVRSYSKRLFSKVGVSRQADLVRLILKSVALLA